VRHTCMRRVLTAGLLLALAACGGAQRASISGSGDTGSASGSPGATVSTEVPPDSPTAPPAGKVAGACESTDLTLDLAVGGSDRAWTFTTRLATTRSCSVTGGLDLPSLRITGQGVSWSAGCEHASGGRREQTSCIDLAEIKTVLPDKPITWTDRWDTTLDGACLRDAPRGTYTAKVSVGGIETGETFTLARPVRAQRCTPPPPSASAKSGGGAATRPGSGAGATASAGAGSVGPGTTVTPGGGGQTSLAPACAPQDVRLDLRTDKGSYAASETVSITVTLTNTSTRTCSAPGRGPGSPDVRAIEAGGKEVWHSGCGSYDGAERPCPMYASMDVNLAPQQSESFSTTWAQRASSGTSEPGPVVARGRYTLACELVTKGQTSVTLA
jgi:hypothetical protein